MVANTTEGYEASANRRRALETIAALAAVVDHSLLAATTPQETAPEKHVAETQSVTADSSSSVKMDCCEKHKDLLIADPQVSQLLPCEIISVPMIAHSLMTRGESDVSLLSMAEAKEESNNKGTPKVGFHAMVSVVEIPSWRDMGLDTIQRLWPCPKEGSQNRLRNAIEYNWVGRDWTKVLEEDQMIYDPDSGNYIHPATWEVMMNNTAEPQHPKGEQEPRLQEEAEPSETVRVQSKKTKRKPNRKRLRRVGRLPPHPNTAWILSRWPRGGDHQPPPPSLRRETDPVKVTT